MTTNRREQLFEAGVQFGHRTQCWCPDMAPFIWGKKDGIHLINVALTDIQLTKAEKLLESIASQGLPILWVGTKKIARQIVSDFAQESESPYFANRWVGGTLTNYHEVKKAVKKMLYNTEIYEKSDSQSVYTKRELNLLQKKVERSKKIISGIEKLSYPIGALIVTDVIKDQVAVKEAIRMGIPIIGLVDTNANPKGITVVIPCNDDLEKSLKIVVKYLADAIKRGKEVFLANNKIEAEKVTLEKTEQEKKQFKPKQYERINNKKGQFADDGKVNQKDQINKSESLESNSEEKSKAREQIAGKQQEKKEFIPKKEFVSKDNKDNKSRVKSTLLFSTKEKEVEKKDLKKINEEPIVKDSNNTEEKHN